MPQMAMPPSTSCRQSRRRGGRKSEPSARGVTPSAALCTSGFSYFDGGFSGLLVAVGVVAVPVPVAVPAPAGGGVGFAIMALCGCGCG